MVSKLLLIMYFSASTKTTNKIFPGGMQSTANNLFKQFYDTDFLINMIYSVATQNEASGEIECKVQFLSCSTQATKTEKQKQTT